MNQNAVIRGELTLPSRVEALLLTLRRNGIESCAVGGCVRDLMRGVTPHDWDAAAAAPPEVLRELLETSGYRVIPTGIKHGTLTVLCPRDDIINEQVARDRANAATVTAAADITATGTTVADTAAIDTAVTGTAATDTTVADMTAADTAASDMTAIDTAVTGTSVADMTAIDTAVTGTSVADTAAIDTAVTGTSVADTTAIDTAAVDDRCAYTRVELTSYRRESGYSDCRHPDSVEYTDSLDEDLARRDFTINAMAYLPGVGVYDPYSGRLDLESHIIRAVGEPTRRFGEDALRILRALRFSAQLGFDIEADTLAAMYSCRGLLANISAERVQGELVVLLRGMGAERVLRAQCEIVSAVLPELGEPALSAGAELLGALRRRYPVESVNDAARIAALMSSLPVATADTCARRLRLDKRTSRRVHDILTHITREYRDRVSVKRLCAEVGTEVAADVLSLALLRGTASPEALDLLAEIIEKGECISLSGLKINGDELIRLGAEPVECGRLLRRLFDEVIEDKLENEPGCLISFAARWINAEKSTCDN